MTLVQLPLDAIDFEVAASCRFRINHAHRRRLNRVPTERLPPVVVFHETAPDGSDHYWLADGGYRLDVAERKGLATISAEVRPGTRADAVLYACQANNTHGVPRTNADKRAAVLKLLGNPLFSGYSNCWIAEQCKVSHTYVARLRARTGQAREPRRGRDGKVRSLPDADSGEGEPAAPSRSSRDVAREELARARAEIEQAIRAVKHAGLNRQGDSKILKKLRAAKQELLVWQQTLEDSPPEPPVPDPEDTSPEGIMAAEMYRIRRMEPAELLGMAQKVMSHDREMMRKGKGERPEAAGHRPGGEMRLGSCREAWRGNEEDNWSFEIGD